MIRQTVVFSGLAALALLLAAGCAGAGVPSTPHEGAPATMIDAEELRAMLENKDFLFINVHIPFEGEIPGTDLHIPYNDIASYTELLPEDKDAKIVLYCRSDSMSGQAAQELAEMGYTNLYDLEDGFNAWEAAGYELLTER